MELILQLGIVALLVESVWESAKMVWQSGKFSVNALGALLLGVMVCTLAHIDLFGLVGITMGVPLVGELLTGILVSRGSNFVHDLLAKLSESRTQA